VSASRRTCARASWARAMPCFTSAVAAYSIILSTFRFSVSVVGSICAFEALTTNESFATLS
jgi:hypothetical protein